MFHLYLQIVLSLLDRSCHFGGGLEILYKNSCVNFFFYYLFPAYTTHCTFLLFTHLFHMFMWWGGVLINLLNSSVQGKKEHNTQLLFYQKIIQSLINLIHLFKDEQIILFLFQVAVSSILSILYSNL